MLWKTHKRIILTISEELNLSSATTDRLIDGVIAPDRWKDYPHHHGKTRTIQEKLLEARQLFLRDEELIGYYNLGVAFHYIQDAYTSFVWNSRNSIKKQEWHQKYEQWIDEAYFVNNLENLLKSVYKKDRRQQEYFYQLLKLLSNQIEGKEETFKVATYNPGKNRYFDSKWGKPVVDLNFAFQVCLALTKSIQGSKTHSKLQDELSTILAKYENNLRDTESEYSQEIVESVLKREAAKKAQGLFSFLSTVLLSRYYNMRAKSKYKRYTEQKHLQKVANVYEKITSAKVRPYRDWYTITINPLNFSIVKKELLTIQEALVYFNKEDSFRNTLENKKLIYTIGNDKIIQISEIQKTNLS
jgi:hypothetical protein